MRRSASLACLLSTALASVAHAQTKSDVDSADSLFKSGKEAMDRGDLAAACPQLAESLRLDPAAGTYLNLGECEARSTQLAAALGHFQAGRALLAAGDYRIPFADQRIADLGRRVPRLAVTWNGELGPDTRVERDGVDVARTTLGVLLPVDPGQHRLVVTSHGQIVAQAVVSLAEGESRTSALSAGAGVGAGAGGIGVGSSQRVGGVVLMSAGGLGLAVGIAFGVVAKATYDSASSGKNCPSGPSSCDSAGVTGGQTAHDQAAISTGTVVAGLALGAGGALVYLLAPKETRLAVAPVVGGGTFGASLGGTW